MVCENKLKKETPKVIEELNEAEINTLMVTGDNPLTAISVAKECKMIPEQSNVYLFERENPKTQTFHLKLISLNSIDKEAECQGIDIDHMDNFFDTLSEINGIYAVTGESFEFLHKLINDQIYQRKIKEFFKRTLVYSRMKPHNKSQLILLLKAEDNFVLMTGGLLFLLSN